MSADKYMIYACVVFITVPVPVEHGLGIGLHVILSFKFNGPKAQFLCPFFVIFCIMYVVLYTYKPTAFNAI